ncbi:hypothetical protein F2Q68_00024345 [Brassica cretica]|uniref:NPK1-activating kinesin-like protein C-terminal domain-containing protein n=1 Tax=Brassica cretica TaxID=69181 RepID=A0A8S9IB62_BRACR|nr:hypothetical protein F2Q68_00024345 [Brassica cretica]
MVLIYVKSGKPAVVSLSSRDFLARRINSRLAPKEREELYMKWDVPPEGKQRKLQFFLARRINSRLAPKEREELYMKWDVPPEGKQRKLQFVNKLWTDPYNSRHMQESAKIVAKLVGFCESGNICKEMIGLNFAMPSDKRWNIVWDLSNILHL